MGSQITFSGITYPCFATTVGTFTGGAGTVTVGNNNTALECGPTTAAETFTFTYGLKIATFYDQTGNGYNLTQATSANQPYLMQNCAGSIAPTAQPCVYPNAYDTDYMSATILSTSDPVTFSAAAWFIDVQGGSDIFAALNSSTYVGFFQGPEAFLYEGTNFGVSISSTFQLFDLQYVTGGPSSSINVQGTITSGNAGTAQSGATTLYFGGQATAHNITGIVNELGVIPGAMSSTNQNLLCHNQYAWWKTATISC